MAGIFNDGVEVAQIRTLEQTLKDKAGVGVGDGWLGSRCRVLTVRLMDV